MSDLDLSNPPLVEDTPPKAAADQAPGSAVGKIDLSAPPMVEDDTPAAPSETPEDKNDFVPYAKGVASSLGHQLGQAASGVGHYVMHPGDAVKDVKDYASDVVNDPHGDVQGLVRAARSMPGLSNVVPDAKALYAGAKAGIHGDNIPDAVYDAKKTAQAQQDQEDADHAKNHPLTDFVQNTLGYALPVGIAAKAGLYASDAFNKELQSSGDVNEALKAARNTVALFTIGEGVSKAPGAIADSSLGQNLKPGGGLHRWMTGTDPDSAARYAANPEKVNAAPSTGDIDTKIREGIQKLKDTTAPESFPDDVSQNLQDQLKANTDASTQSINNLDAKGVRIDAVPVMKDIAKARNDLLVNGNIPQSGIGRAKVIALNSVLDELKRAGDVTVDGMPADGTSLTDGSSEVKPQYTIKGSDVKRIIQNAGSEASPHWHAPDGAKAAGDASAYAYVYGVLSDALKAPTDDDVAVGRGQSSYADEMADLKPKVDANIAMSKHFGTAAKVDAALKNIGKNNFQGQQAMEALRGSDQHFGTDYENQLLPYIEAQKTLPLVKGLNVDNPTDKIQSGSYSGREAAKALDTHQESDLLDQADDSKAKADLGPQPMSKGLIPRTPLAKAVMVGGAIVPGRILAALAERYGAASVKTAIDAGINLSKLADSPLIKPIMEAAQRGPTPLLLQHARLMQNPDYVKLNQGASDGE